MEDPALDIGFDHDGKQYTGWARPSEHLESDSRPKSYHVVLNGIMFGNVSQNKGNWTVDEGRPGTLTKAVGAMEI